jgi:hypothetical protein
MENNKYTYNDILPFLRTKEEVIHFQSQIDTMLAELFKVHPKDHPLSLTAVFAPQFAHGVSNSITKNKLDLNDRNALKFFFMGMKDALRSMKVLKVTIAIHPTTELISNIAAYAKREFGLETVLDCTVNPAIAGGAVIMYDGKFLDMSLTNRVSQYLSSHRDDITKLFHDKK